MWNIQTGHSMLKHSRYSVPVLVVLFVFGVAVVLYKFTEITVFNKLVYRQKNFLNKLNELSEQIPFDSIHNDYDFIHFSTILKSMQQPPYLILFDSSNIDIVLNHICNLKFIPNALPRLVAVSFDQNALDLLRAHHPTVPSVLVDLEKIIKTIDPDLENRRYLIYTLALVTHAKICASLALSGIDFWSMHQDSLWVENFASMNMEDRHPEANLIFDTIGNELPHYHRMQNWICGATFFVRAGTLTFQFFRQLEHYMLSHQSPDSSIMTYLCGHHQYKCVFLPHWITSSFDYFSGPRDYVPVLLQLDAPKIPGETKFQMMKKSGFIFREDNGTCNAAVFHRLRDSVKTAFLERQQEGKLVESWMQKLTFGIKNAFNSDPYNRKWFLQIHYSML